MKKILALALAMIMTLGLASVAFAADPTECHVAAGTTIYYKNGSGSIVAYDEEYLAAPDTSFYVPLSGDKCDDKTTVSRYKAFFDAKVGKMASDPEIVFVKINGNYVYAVEFKTPDVTTKSYDLAGDLKVATTASAAKNLADEYVVAINLEVGYEEANGSEGLEINNDFPVITFDDADDVVDLEDENAELFLFSVNADGQSDVNMKYSTKFDSSFAAKYDYANIDFLKFSKSPVFNRTGDLYIYADEDSYIYEVTADGAKEIANAEYDEDYGAWHIRTRSLKAYAISDSELKATESASSTPAESTGSSTGSTGKPNPGTGR